MLRGKVNGQFVPLDAFKVIGLLALALGLVYVSLFIAGEFDKFDAAKPGATPVWAQHHKVSHKAPEKHWGLQEYFPLPTCTGGDIQSTWRECTPRFHA